MCRKLITALALAGAFYVMAADFVPLYRHGQSVRFITNADTISASGQWSADNAPELYRTDCNGRVSQLRPICSNGHVTWPVDSAQDWHACGSDYDLYLPFGVNHEDISVAVPDSCRFSFRNNVSETCISLPYKPSPETSAYAARLQRALDMPVEVRYDGKEHKMLPIENIVKAMHMEGGTLPTMQPVRQRREPYNYEWLDRHYSKLHEVITAQPKNLIIGNSIVHYWGGDSAGRNGTESWQHAMAPAGYFNLGCGWDRIENVLWRVYHRELNGFEASKIVLMIGTNNLAESSDEMIVSGLQFLIEAIRYRQPKAEIKIVGILPRHDMLERVATVNRLIEPMATEAGCKFVNPGLMMLNADGSLRSELFLPDGLHPNNSGYELLIHDILE